MLEILKTNAYLNSIQECRYNAYAVSATKYSDNYLELWMEISDINKLKPKPRKQKIHNLDGAGLSLQCR